MHRLTTYLHLVLQPYIRVALGNVRLLKKPCVIAVKVGCGTVISGSGALQGGCGVLPSNPRSIHREWGGSVRWPQPPGCTQQAAHLSAPHGLGKPVIHVPSRQSFMYGVNHVYHVHSQVT